MLEFEIIQNNDDTDSFKLSSFLLHRLYDKNLETNETIERQFSKIIIEELL